MDFFSGNQMALLFDNQSGNPVVSDKDLNNSPVFKHLDAIQFMVGCLDANEKETIELMD